MATFGRGGPRRFSLFMPMPVGDSKLDRVAANAGATAGFLLAAINGAIVLAALFGYSIVPVPPSATPADIALGQEVIFGPLTVIELLFSWRVNTGRGYISAILLLVLAVAELVALFPIVLSVHFGTTFICIVLLKFLFDGVRGTWSARKRRKGPDVEVFD